MTIIAVRISRALRTGDSAKVRARLALDDALRVRRVDAVALRAVGVAGTRTGRDEGRGGAGGLVCVHEERVSPLHLASEENAGTHQASTSRRG